MQLFVLSSLVSAADQTSDTTSFISHLASQYQSVWKKIPQDFTRKMKDAIIDRKVTYNDVANLTASAIDGFNTLRAAGFSFPDALELQRDFGSPDTTAKETSVKLPLGVPTYYLPQWNKVPESLQTKLANAINTKKISPSDLADCIGAAHRGAALLTSIGFSFDDAVELEGDLGQQ